MDAARALFEELRAKGEALIEQYVREGEQETLILDFKLARGNAAPMEVDDRKTLAEAISGFANAGGGVIVWGVDARKGPGPDDPDRAQSTVPIENLGRWISDLNGQTAQVVSPALAGVEHLPILIADGNNQGFAVTYVPESDGPPIMAIARQKDQYSYYTRSGSSFIKMEAYMVADRFARRTQPKLRPYFYIREKEDRRTESGQKTHHVYSVTIGVENYGHALARFPGLRFNAVPPVHLDMRGLGGNQVDGLPRHVKAYGVTDPWHLFAGGANDVVYPGTQKDVTNLRFVFEIQAAHLANVGLDFELYAEGFSSFGRLEIPIDRLDDFGVLFRPV